MSTPVENLVSRLHAKRSGEGWKAKCPVHDDRDPSLSIDEGSDGRALIKCHAGCQTNDILAAIGLKPRDLFVSGKNGSEPPKQTPSGKTTEKKPEPINWQQCVDAFTEKHLECLSDWRGYTGRFCSWLHRRGLVGLHEGKYGDCIAFPVEDKDGHVIAAHCRPKSGKWFYEAGVPVQPFIIGDLKTAKQVHLFESQWDMFAFMDRTELYLEPSVAFVCTRGAENAKLVQGLFQEGVSVCAWPQNDAPGMKWLGELPKYSAVPVAKAMTPSPHKDLNDWRRAGATVEDIYSAFFRNELVEVSKLPESEILPEETADTSAEAEIRGEIKNLDAYNENDGGNAEMFADRYSGIVRYIHARESWFIWDGNRWSSDAVENVHQLALELSKTLAADLLKTPGRPDKEKLRRAIAMGTQSKISAMLWLSRSDPRIVIKREEIDADNFLLGARNGVIDLRTGQRRDGRKGDFITKSCGCNHEAAATAPRWRAFLKEIFDEQDDLIEYIQRLVGYSLTGDTREQCLVFLYGSGANGKSTFIETLVELLGDYATTASQNILCYNKHVREPLDEIASLEGARFVSIAETGESHMAEVRIKQLTGGDTVTGKPHYKAAMNFRPKFKLWIFGNSRPTIYGVDYAMWRRIQLIPFNVQFPVEKQDSTLKEKLFRELPGILNWAVDGALAWQAEGRLVPPECVVAATNQYREDEDALRDFIAEKIESAKGHELAHKELYRAYKNWHADGSSEKPFSSKKIAQMLRDRGYKTSAGPARSLLWWGIGLKEDENSGEVSENSTLLQTSRGEPL